MPKTFPPIRKELAAFLSSLGDEEESIRGGGFLMIVRRTDAMAGGRRNKGSSSVTQKDRESQSKRKPDDDSPLTPAKPSSSLPKLLPLPESCLEKPQNSPSNVGENLEVGSTQPRVAAETSQRSEWDDPVARQFEELLLSSLYTIFQNAIKQVVDRGYSEDVAFRAIAREGLYRGGKDLVSNVVNDTLTFLKKGKHIGSKDSVFGDLKQLVEFTMLEMVNVLKEVKPSLCIAEAMWWLLMCDMNISLACAVKGDRLDESNFKEILAGNSSESAPSHSSSEAQTVGPSFPMDNESNCKTESHPSETLKSEILPTLPNSESPLAPEALTPEKGSSASMPAGFEKSLAATLEYLQNASKTYISEEKPKPDGKLLHKKGNAAGQKFSHLDWCYKQYGKSVSKSGKICTIGGVVLEKRMKHPSELPVAHPKGPISKAKGKAKGPLTVGSPQVPPNAPSSVSAPADSSKVPMEESKPLDVAKTALASSSEKVSASKPEASAPVFPNISDYYAAIPYDKSLGKYVPQTKRDELILRLVSRVKQLQDELQSWTEWGNQKVMQAAQRLKQDKAELKALRQEKEEAERYRKEKKILEENAAKRLSEMETALNGAISQAEKADYTLRKLEVENVVLKKEMKDAKSEASNAATRCQEALQREQQAQKDAQSWEGQKALLREELMVHKKKVAELQQDLNKKKDLHSQYEAKWKQEKMSNEDLLAQAASMRKEREELEAATKAEQDGIKQKAENDLQKYLEGIKKLESEVSELRMKSDASKIAALRRGADGNFGVTNSGAGGTQESKVNFGDNSGAGGLRRERECVMCLSEEMSVVFLPCAHQVLCPDCNELHEKQEMKECPSCRTPIQRRILARFAHP